MNKSTDDLNAEINKITDLKKYLKDNKEELVVPNPIEYLLKLCQTKKLSKADLIRRSGLERTFGYHLLDGSKTLTRDKAIALCIGAQLTIEESNNLLKYAKLSQFYSRDQRDLVIQNMLQKEASLDDANLLLLRLNLPIIE